MSETRMSLREQITADCRETMGPKASRLALIRARHRKLKAERLADPMDVDDADDFSESDDLAAIGAEEWE